MTKESELQDIMFGIIIKGSILLSIVSVVVNIGFGFPLGINVKWVILFTTSVYSYWLCDAVSKKITYFTTTTLFFLPYIWFDSGGCTSVVPYILLVMFFISFIFQKSERTLLLFILLIVVSSLIAIEYKFPHVLAESNIKSYSGDKFIQLVATLLFGHFVIVQFAKAYLKDKQKLREANEKLNYFAHMDSLTNVYNRRAFDKKMEEVLKNREHVDNEMWVMIADIDYFKKINDNYGHREGDRIICKLADYAKDITGDDTFIARWGGDEFCIITQVEKKKLIKMLNIYYEKIKKIKTRDNEPVTVSLGVTRLHENDDMISVFKRADELLYNSKKKGRARYTIA